jgi:hypothetical protein
MTRLITTLVVTLAMLFIASFVFMLSWNAVVPSVFGLRALDFAASFAMLVTVFVISRVAAPPAQPTADPNYTTVRIPKVERTR